MAVGSMFLLDTSQRRFYTCCGSIHVKMAFLVLVLVTVVAEILEGAVYIFADNVDISTKTELIMEAIEYFVTVTMIIAFVKESSMFLFPYILQMFVVFVMLVLNTATVIFAIFAPYSQTAEMFFSGLNQTLIQREKILLFTLAIMVSITTLIGWCLHVGLCCYTYFEGRDAERRTKQSRPAVDLEAGGNRPSPLVLPSFGNPNFSLDDDEDDVFQAKANAPQMV